MSYKAIYSGYNPTYNDRLGAHLVFCSQPLSLLKGLSDQSRSQQRSFRGSDGSGFPKKGVPRFHVRQNTKRVRKVGCLHTHRIHGTGIFTFMNG